MTRLEVEYHALIIYSLEYVSIYVQNFIWKRVGYLFLKFCCLPENSGAVFFERRGRGARKQTHRRFHPA